MNSDLDTHIKTLHNLASAPRTHQLTNKEITGINAGISALMIIRDGNYQLETNNIDISVKHSPDITKGEVIATLRAIANIIEKGIT